MHWSSKVSFKTMNNCLLPHVVFHLKLEGCLFQRTILFSISFNAKDIESRRWNTTFSCYYGKTASTASQHSCTSLYSKEDSLFSSIRSKWWTTLYHMLCSILNSNCLFKLICLLSLIQKIESLAKWDSDFPLVTQLQV